LKTKRADKIRVLHLPVNVSSIPSTAAKILKDRGHEVYVISLAKSNIQSNEGVIFVPVFRAKGIFSKILIRLLKTIYFIYYVSKVDIVHYHQTTFTYRPSLEALIIKALNKRAIVQFHGSEIRVPEIEFLDNIYYKEAYLKNNLKYFGTLTKSKSVQEAFSKITDSCIHSYAKEKYVDKTQFTKTYVVFHPFEVSRVQPKYPDPDKREPLVVHAPSKRNIKGTSHVLRTIELLKKQGYKFDFKLIEGMEHEKALQLLGEADIILDEFILSGYEMLSLEGMALGKPVVTFLLENTHRKYPNSLPIVNANIDNLPQKLAMLIKDGNLRYRLGVEGRKYVETYHSEEAYYENIIGIYKELLAEF
jgi:glycosyltransferase involved in cell wall biosynthesis